LAPYALAVLATALILACGGGTSAGWTYAPLGPTPEAPASAAPSAGGSPGESPGGNGGPGEAFEVVTPPDDPLAFIPDELEMSAAASVTVSYLNDSNLPHNINFFAGADSSAPSIGMTQVVTGPGAEESVTFEAPSQPGTYYFWCDVHLTAMDGTYTVQ
jgi:plastocyanin